MTTSPYGGSRLGSRTARDGDFHYRSEENVADEAYADGVEFGPPPLKFQRGKRRVSSPILEIADQE